MLLQPVELEFDRLPDRPPRGGAAVEYFPGNRTVALEALAPVADAVEQVLAAAAHESVVIGRHIDPHKRRHPPVPGHPQQRTG